MVPIVHPARVAHAGAVRLCLALGCPRVRVAGLRATSAAVRAQVLTAATTASDPTLELELDGIADRAAAAIDALVRADAAYVDLHTASASLRVWPDRAWIHRWALPDGGADAVAADLARLTGLPIAPAATLVLDATRVTIDPAAAAVVDLRTTDRELGRALFHAWRGGRMLGHVAGPTPAAVAAIRELLDATDGTLDASLTVDLVTAAALTAIAPADGLVWQAAEFTITWPDGEIGTHRLMPVAPDDARTWMARIAAALTR